MTIEDERGCQMEITLEIPAAPFLMILPNAFTPDGDGDNDLFDIVANSEDFEVVRFQICNRWGTIVYDNNTPHTDCDGYHNGEPAPAGVYLYQLEVRSPGDVELVYQKGEILLLRCPPSKKSDSPVPTAPGRQRQHPERFMGGEPEHGSRQKKRASN